MIAAAGSTPAIWCDLSVEERLNMSVFAMVINSPIDQVLLRAAHILDSRPSSHLKIAYLARNAEEISRAKTHGDLVVIDDAALLPALRASGAPNGFAMVVRDTVTLDAAKHLIGTVDYLITRFTDETNIPLEELLAAAQGSKTGIIKRVSNAADAVTTSGVLEHGPYGVLLDASLESLVEVKQRLLQASYEPLAVVEATVTRAYPVGMGHRGCIDSTSLLEKDEGMIVGSTSSGGILVCAEVHPMAYLNTRPFRVNAGAVHSYVWAPGERTEYVTDLRAGKRVLAVSIHGQGRPVTIGRVKTEVRPLRLIEARVGDSVVNAIIQDDWHIRIMGADGKPLNGSAVQAGNKILAHICDPGRHAGIKIDETILEC